jgi:ribosome biogenesis GTPase
LLPVLTVNGTSPESCEQFKAWCQLGRTIVLPGSSGAGKSTLANTHLQRVVHAIGNIREDDSKGKHTTTSRSLLPMESGALLLDAPGMRKLQLFACEEGVSATFHEIESLAG